MTSLIEIGDKVRVKNQYSSYYRVTGKVVDLPTPRVASVEITTRGGKPVPFDVRELEKR